MTPQIFSVVMEVPFEEVSIVPELPHAKNTLELVVNPLDVSY